MLYSISHSLPLAASTRCAAACASRPACPCRWRPASRSRSTSQTVAALPTAIRQTARPVIATASWTTVHRWRMQPGICCQAAAEAAAHPPASSTAAAPHASFRYFIATRRCRCATSFTFVVIYWVSRVCVGGCVPCTVARQWAAKVFGRNAKVLLFSIGSINQRRTQWNFRGSVACHQAKSLPNQGLATTDQQVYSHYIHTYIHIYTKEYMAGRSSSRQLQFAAVIAFAARPSARPASRCRDTLRCTLVAN